MNQRRQRGTGTIETADGRFVPRLPGKRGKRLDPVDTYAEAAAVLEEALRILAEGQLVNVDGVTLADFAEGAGGFLDRREVTHANAKDDRSTWRSCVAPSSICRRPMKTLAPPDIRAWRDELLARKARPGHGHTSKPTRRLSRRRVQNALNLLRVALGDAVERGIVPSNPAAGVALPRAMGLTHDPWTYLEPPEIEQLMACEAIPEDDRLLYEFMILAGPRESEAWNQHLRDLRGVRLINGRVELDPGAVMIVRYGGHGVCTKGRRSREIPIALFHRVLERWLPRLAERCNPEGLLWPQADGGRRADGEMPRHWYRHLGLAGIVTVRENASSPVEAADCVAPDRHDGMVPTFHALRHTCGARLVSGWAGRRWSLQEVQKLLGHRSVTTTERYASLAKSALQDAAEETAAARVDLPKISPALSACVAASARNDSAPPRRLERPTNGLGNRARAEAFREDSSSAGEIAGRSPADVGRGILAAIAEGGPGAWRKVTELAAELLEMDAVDAPDASSSGRGSGGRR